MAKILFVCLGNICRSPLAEGIAKDINKKRKLHFTIESAGTSARHAGEHPCEDSRIIAFMNKIDISQYRSRQVTKEDKEDFDYVVVMDESTKKKLEGLGFENIYLLGSFDHYKGANVPDPYFFDEFDDRIRSAYRMIDRCVRDFMYKVEKNTLNKTLSRK